MNQVQKRIAVVGGGISGLAAAYRLSRCHPVPEVTVFEARKHLGGVLQTELADGYCLEMGPDSMLSRLPWAVEFCREIGFAEELISTNPDERGVYVVCRGKLQRVPEGLAVMAPQRITPFVTTRILSWGGKLRLAAEAFVKRCDPSREESLAAFSRRRFGRETYERLVQPLASGIYMGDPEKLSIQATFPQFVAMEREHGSLIRAARAAQGGQDGNGKATSGGPEYSLFVAPRRGAGQLIDAVAKQLTNCEIKSQHRVARAEMVGSTSRTEVAPAPPRWQLQVEDGAAGEVRTESFDGLVVAVPAHQAGALLDGVNTELGGWLKQIPYAGCAVVNLAYERADIPHPLDAFGFVVPHIEEKMIRACTFSSVKYAERAPEGIVLLRAFLGGACYPEVLDWSDDQVLQAVRDELRELLGIQSEPRLTRVARWRDAMPQYHLGHQQLVRQIEEGVAQYPTLALTGNAYHGVGIPHCIRGGQDAADRLAAELQIESPSSSQSLHSSP